LEQKRIKVGVDCVITVILRISKHFSRISEHLLACLNTAAVQELQRHKRRLCAVQTHLKVSDNN